MSERDDQALALYRKARVDDQLGFYNDRSDEYARAAAQSTAVVAVLLSLTTLAGSLAGLDIGGKLGWAIAAAVIPAASTALAAYDALFGFERLSKLYADAVNSLRLIDAPDLAAVTAPPAEVARYAVAVEDVFQKEQAQWGQLTAEIELSEAKKKSA